MFSLLLCIVCVLNRNDIRQSRNVCVRLRNVIANDDDEHYGSVCSIGCRIVRSNTMSCLMKCEWNKE